MKPFQWNWLGGTVVAAAATWMLTGCDRKMAETEEAAGSYEAQVKQEDQAREKDPAWQPSHKEVGVIKVGQRGQGTLNNFCLDPDGRVLACVGGGPQASGHAIQVYSPDGKLTQTWALKTEPQALCLDQDGTVIVGGGGQIARLDRTGKVLASAPTPVADQALPPDADLQELAKRFGTGTPETRLRELKGFLTNRRTQVTGVATSGEDVFLACPSTKDYSYVVYRLDKEFKHPKLIIEKLSGCCGQMDVQARDGKLWVAHNARHRVECHDRDGKLLANFGRLDRKAADGFGGCCEPKNLRLLANGEVLCAESGPPVAVKRFTTDGKFLGVAALPTFRMGCVRTTVDLSADGKRYFVLNGDEHAIHIFAAKE